MPSDSVRDWLQDIVDNIDYANEFIAGMTWQMFAGDRRTFYAVTRCLEIVSKASRRLPDSLKQRHPDIPWRAMAAAGSVYRHDYEDVAEWCVSSRCSMKARVDRTGFTRGRTR